MIRFLFSFPHWMRVLFSLLYLVLVVILSTLPQNDLPTLDPFAGFDKLVHASMYFGLTILACWAFQAEEKRLRILYIILFAIIWGMIMEIFQQKMNLGREFDMKDELSNSIGALIGAGLYVWISGYYQQRMKRETGT